MINVISSSLTLLPLRMTYDAKEYVILKSCFPANFYGYSQCHILSLIAIWSSSVVDPIVKDKNT